MSKTGSIYQRKSDGRWVGKYYVTDPMTGKTKPKYVYSSKPGRKGQQEVRRKLYALIEKVEAGDLSDTSKLTVAGWLEKFLEIYCDDLAETTKEGYRRYIENHINPVLGDIKLRDLKPIHIQNFYKHERNVPRYKTRIKNGKVVPILNENGEPVPLMKNGEPVIGYSEKTILQIHRILKRAFSKAVADGLLSKNPCDAVDAPSPEEYEPSIYTEEEFMLLLDKLKGHHLEPIILLAGMCGLRRAELLGLTWEDIDWEKGTLKVVETVVPTKKGNLTKGPKSRAGHREIAIPSIIMLRLKQLRGIGKICTRQDGKEYHPGSISRMFADFLKRNGLRHIRLHDLRHFNATMMLKHGVSEREAQERLGHSSSRMTKHYQHILEEMDRSSADKLNNVLQSQENI